MNAQPAPVVSGRYISGDRPFECTHVIPLDRGGISSKAGAEAVSADAGPAATPANENPVLSDASQPKAAPPRAFRSRRRENECIRFFQLPDITRSSKKVWLGIVPGSVDVCSTSLFTAYCQLLTANCLLVEGHEQPIRPGLFKRRLGLQTLEGRHLLRGKVLIVTRTVDLRERVVRPGVPGLDARSDLELAQRAFFVSQPPQGFPQSEVSLKHGGTGLRSPLEAALGVLHVLLVSVDAAKVDEGCGVARVQLAQGLEDLKRVIPLVLGPMNLGDRA